MSDLRDTEGFLDDEDLPILPDEEYQEVRRTLGIGETTGAPQGTLETSEEQLLYAKILATGMYIGLAVLLTTFALYITGILAPAVPIAELPNYWTLSAHEYLEAINHDFLHRDAVVVGWGWLAVLNKGDFLNFVGIALLSLVTIVCYMGIIPLLLKKKDWIYAGIALLEILVLASAASGLIAVGH